MVLPGAFIEGTTLRGADAFGEDGGATGARGKSAMHTIVSIFSRYQVDSRLNSERLASTTKI